MTATFRFSPELGPGLLGLILDAPTNAFRTRLPEHPVSHHRVRTNYLRMLKRAREALNMVTREGLPEAMASLPAPAALGDRVNLEWLAWRDALLEHALAHGYIVGQAGERVYANSKDYWSVEAVGVLGPRTYRYRIGGPTVKIGKMPAIGQPLLLTRGHESTGPYDRQDQAYIPVGHQFLHDPVDMS